MADEHQDHLVDGTLERLVGGMGAMNAHMEHVRSDVASMKSDVSGIKDDVTVLKERDAARTRRVLGLGTAAGGGSSMTLIGLFELIRHLKWPA